MQENSLTIPNFISASTPSGLRLSCLQNNARMNAYVKYYAITYDPNEKMWYAWFYESVETMGAVDDKKIVKKK